VLTYSPPPKNLPQGQKEAGLLESAPKKRGGLFTAEMKNAALSMLRRDFPQYRLLKAGKMNSRSN
jgi:hypothetical protein